MMLSRKISYSGFSLPEVTLAVGITALGILAIMGLIPQGLEMSRQIGNITVERHIVEQVIREVEQTDWKDLASGKALKQYDDQGVEISNGAGAAMAAYLAETEVVNKVMLPKGKANSEAHLRQVVVKIASTINPTFDFSDANRRNFSMTTHLLARSQGSATP